MTPAASQNTIESTHTEFKRGLNVIEEAYFDIPELSRLKDEPVATVRCFRQAGEAEVTDGKIESYEFPLVVMTSNGERDFPAPFLRRCLQVRMPDPCADTQRLREIVRAHLGDSLLAKGESLIREFADRGQRGDLLATDQLLNAILLTQGGYQMTDSDRGDLVERLTEAIGRQDL